MSVQSWQETLITSQGDGNTLTAAAAATMLPAQAKCTLPPNFFSGKGKKIRICASGRISCVVTTPGTARYDVRFVDSAGTTVTVFDSLAMNLNIVAKTNVHWMLEIILTARIDGGSVQQLLGQGFWSSEAVIASPLPTAGGSGSLLIPVGTAPAVGTAFDATKANTIDMFFTQTVATGSMTCHQYHVESLN